MFMASSGLILRHIPTINSTNRQNVGLTLRYYHYKFTRVQTPPLQKPKESPYIVGPYLKPKYMPIEYTTEPLKTRDYNDFNHFIYEPTKIEPDESRTVKLLLTKDVEGFGVAGQIVDVPYRYGSSKLVAMKKAEYATDFAKNWHKFGDKTSQSASSALSPRTARLLRTRVFDLPINHHVKVQSWHISLALRLSGCICPQEAIERDSIEIKDGLVECVVRINNHERVTVKFQYLTKIQEDEH